MANISNPAGAHCAPRENVWSDRMSLSFFQYRNSEILELSLMHSYVVEVHVWLPNIIFITLAGKSKDLSNAMKCVSFTRKESPKAEHLLVVRGPIFY